MQVSNVYVKKYLNEEPRKKRHFGLNYLQSFNIELKCLQRLKGYDNICQLIDYDVDQTTLTLEWAGHNLNYFFDPIKKYKKHKRRLKKKEIKIDYKLTNSHTDLTRIDFKSQIESAFNIFEKENIVHFDLGPWNICLKNYNITIIDFGCAVLDGIPLYPCLEEPYQKFLSNGGWATQKEKTFQRINSILRYIKNE